MNTPGFGACCAYYSWYILTLRNLVFSMINNTYFLFNPFLSYCSYTEKLYYKKIYIKIVYSTIFTINSLFVSDITDHKQNQTQYYCYKLICTFFTRTLHNYSLKYTSNHKIYLTRGRPCTLRMSAPSQPAASIPAPFYGAN